MKKSKLKTLEEAYENVTQKSQDPSRRLKKAINDLLMKEGEDKSLDTLIDLIIQISRAYPDANQFMCSYLDAQIEDKYASINIKKSIPSRKYHIDPS